MLLHPHLFSLLRWLLHRCLFRQIKVNFFCQKLKPKRFFLNEDQNNSFTLVFLNFLYFILLKEEKWDFWQSVFKKENRRLFWSLFIFSLLTFTVSILKRPRTPNALGMVDYQTADSDQLMKRLRSATQTVDEVIILLFQNSHWGFVSYKFLRMIFWWAC